MCLVKGIEEFHPEGYHYHRVKRDGKWAWVALGRDPSTAWNKSLAQAKVREPEFVPGIPGVPDPKPEPVSVAKNPACRVDDEVRVYLSNVAKLAPKTYNAYKRSLELFQESCKKIYVHQISKQDLQKFDTDLMEQGNEDRTRHN